MTNSDRMRLLASAVLTLLVIALTSCDPKPVEPEAEPVFSWQPMQIGVTFRDVWGTAADSLYVVGDGGVIRRYDGEVWIDLLSPTDENLNGIWGSSLTNVYAVGDEGTIIHYDGLTWSEVNSPTNEHLFAIWGSSADDIFASGRQGLMVH